MHAYTRVHKYAYIHVCVHTETVWCEGDRGSLLLGAVFFALEMSTKKAESERSKVFLTKTTSESRKFWGIPEYQLLTLPLAEQRSNAIGNGATDSSFGYFHYHSLAGVQTHLMLLNDENISSC